MGEMITCLLGFVDELLEKNTETNFATNKIGGLPDWIDGIKRNIICQLCHSTMPLILQIYCPVIEKLCNHRTLYIFSCLSPECCENSKGWICLRLECKVEQDEKMDQVVVSADGWNDDACNWNNDTGLQVPPNLVNNLSKNFQAMDIKEFVEDIPDNTVEFQSYYINVAEERNDHNNCSVRNLRGFEKYKDIGIEDASTDDGVYEREMPIHKDILFHKFIKRIQKNPSQILRYCRNNNAPLWLKIEENVPTRCKRCGGPVIFEMQILPTLIFYTKSSLKYGSIYIFTCKNSCDGPPMEEIVILHEERF